jgi:hypothetical protein
MSMKISNDAIGNRTGDLPACSAVPQPNAPSGAPIQIMMLLNKQFCSASFKFLSPRSTYCPQHPAPKHPHSLLYPQPFRAYLATVTEQSDAVGSHDWKDGAVGRRSTLNDTVSLPECRLQCHRRKCNSCYFNPPQITKV